jgi:hypothetical protein
MRHSSLDLPSFLAGQTHEKFDTRLKVVEDWQRKWEGYVVCILSYSRRVLIVLVVWGMATVTNAFPETVAAKLASIIGRMLGTL